MIKFVYFDIGGVLNKYKMVFTDAPLKFGIDREEFGKVFDDNDDDITRGKIDVNGFWNLCVQKFNIKNGENFDMAESWANDFEINKPNYDLVIEVKKKYKVGLLSNHYKGVFKAVSKRYLIPRINYDQVILSCECGLRKPEREIYLLAQQKAGCKPEEIFYIDDNKSYISVAKSFGWQTFWYDSANYQKSSLLLTECVKILV